MPPSKNTGQKHKKVENVTERAGVQDYCRDGIHSRGEQNEMFRCFSKINAKVDKYQWGSAS